MAMNRDKFRNIVGGITTPESKAPPTAPPPSEQTDHPADSEMQAASTQTTAGEGSDTPIRAEGTEAADSADNRRFAKRGRPKGRKPDVAAGKDRKVKISLFLSEIIVNDLYEWAHADKMHPGEMFEAALKPFHEREAKRRKAGKE